MPKFLTSLGKALRVNLLMHHPQEQGISCMKHRRFAWRIRSLLMKCVAGFAVNALLQLIPLSVGLDIESTARLILEQIEWRETVGGDDMQSQPDLGSE